MAGKRCQVNQAYWARNPQGPFATLIGVAATYCHPEAYNDAYPELMRTGPVSGAGGRGRSASSGTELHEALADPESAAQ